MLLHVSNGAYIESICLSERFLVHVEALFAGIDKIHCIYQEYKQTGIHSTYMHCITKRSHSIFI
jgi:hypothetical protein